MNKNLKLGLGVALWGTAIYLIYKQSKDKKAKANQDPTCKAGEELVTETVNVPCMPSPSGDTSNCKSIETKVCKPKASLTTGGVQNEELQMEEASQTEGFGGY